MASSAAPASATVLVPAVTSAPAPSPAAHPPLAPVANPTPSPSADPAPAPVAAPAPPPAPVAAAANPTPSPSADPAPPAPPAADSVPPSAPAAAPAPAPAPVVAPAPLPAPVAAPVPAPATVATPASHPASIVAPAPAVDPIPAPTLAPSPAADPAPTPTADLVPAPAADPVPAPAADLTPASTKPKPLHHFELPELWNKDGQASVPKKPRSSIKLPSQRLSAPPVPLPLPQEPVLMLRPQEPISMSPPLPRIQSPVKDSFKLSSDDILVRDDSRIKQSSICEELPKLSPNDEERKLPPVVFDYSEKLSLLSAEIQRHSEKRNPSWESEALTKGKGRNHSKNSPFPIFNSGAGSSNAEKTYEKKLEKRSKPTEEDESGNKKPKIMIKISSKNRKEDEQNSTERLLKTGITDNHNEINEAPLEEGKLNINWDDETRLWDLRPRKPKSKLKKVADVAKKSNVPKLPEKNKAQPQMKNAIGVKEGKNNSEKKNKSEKHEREEKKEKLSEKNEKGEKKEKSEKPDNEKKKEKGEKGEKEKGDMKKEKKKLSISITLTKEEIEEDLFALTGSKPTRRPKKRAKNVQKQLDSVFPGLWLVSISPDSYKVSESSMKG